MKNKTPALLIFLLSLLAIMSLSTCFAGQCNLNGRSFSQNPVAVDLSDLINGTTKNILSGNVLCVTNGGRGSFTYSTVRLGPDLVAAGAGIDVTFNNRSPNPNGTWSTNSLVFDKNMPISAVLHISQDAGHALIIHKGDLIFSFDIGISVQTASGGSFEENDKFTLVAGNDATINTGTCDINNGNMINVNFGTLPVKKLSTSILSAGEANTREVALNYTCDNPNLEQDIKIDLIAPTANFSIPDGGNVVATTTPSVGIAIVSHAANIRPGSYFKSKIERGTGTDSLKIIVLRDPKKSVDAIATGAFSASAVMIMESD